jgi:GT2 family glycosyltransferase
LFKKSVIIPTYNRPLDLQNCIQSILDQSVKPEEIIVIDDGNLLEFPLNRECTKAKIKCLFKKKHPPGVVESRNIGAKIASGDILFFLEDDVALFPDYIEEILKVYDQCQRDDLGGVGGVVVETKKLTLSNRLLRLFSILFLLSGFQAGKILPSGFDTTDFGEAKFPTDRIQEVDFLAGGVCSYKKTIFEDFQFCHKYQSKSGYAQGEDREFGYRVSKKYKLLLSPNAKVHHFRSPKTGDANKKIKGRSFVLSRYLFFRDHLNEKWWRWSFFFYALAGHLILRVIIMLVSLDKNEFDRVKGILSAIKSILRGKLSSL